MAKLVAVRARGVFIAPKKPPVVGVEEAGVIQTGESDGEGNEEEQDDDDERPRGDRDVVEHRDEHAKVLAQWLDELDPL